MKIDPNKLYWATFNYFELRLLGACVIACNGSGDQSGNVEFWTPHVKMQVDRDAFKNAPNDETIRKELKQYGAWDAKELQDSEMNWQRLVWIAACNINEEDTPDYSDPAN